MSRARFPDEPSMPEEAEDAAHRLRPMFCCLGEVTRADGSAVLCQGDTTVVCGVYGPAEVKAAREVIDRAVVEVRGDGVTVSGWVKR